MSFRCVIDIYIYIYIYIYMCVCVCVCIYICSFDYSWISHVFIYQWLFIPRFAIVMLLYDWRVCVTSVLSTTKHS